MGRSIVTIDDLTNDEIENVFALADEFLQRLAVDGKPERLRGRIQLAEQCVLATLFFEPSTRTRFSFESAMLRLGGHILSSADPASSSAAKGESIADMIRVVQNYADLIVIRHPLEGAARVAAEFADIPVINGGDGRHEHPTQTLCDLYTLRREKKKLKNLNVQLRGDLKRGRTVHSLVYALARFGANIITSSAPGLELPAYVVRRLQRDYDCGPIDVEGLPDDVDGVYVTRRRAVQATLPNLPPDFLIDVSSKGFSSKDFRKIDIFYVTRLQSERPDEEGQKADYPVVSARFLKDRRYRDSSVLHPLPRLDELAYDVDQDDRALYFKQASYGVPVRMALLAALLGLQEGVLAKSKPAGHYPLYTRRGGIACLNPFCVTRNEPEQNYLASKFWILEGDALTLRCLYCDHETTPQCVGRISTKRYDTDLSRWTRIPLEDLIMFADRNAAHAAGFQLYKSRSREHDPLPARTARGVAGSGPPNAAP
ncbi:MAG: hypothetical protein IH888_06520 [Planctomycetes bacterium]|nr:hypothetical protein [Planctomycetota bacterium]